jgi:mono/diheme cytochrome c family protein
MMPFTTSRRTFWVLVVGACVAIASIGRGAAASRALPPDDGRPDMAIWRGVYTTAQAARGRMTFELTCSGCHGQDASGGGDGPPLLGAGFINNWLEDSVGGLFTKIQTRMPADAPGTLAEPTVADLVSFLLQANEFPPGPQELAPKAESLFQIRIVGKDGPAPVPNFSLVVVEGCLVQEPDAAWTLTGGTEPVRARVAAPPASAALNATPGSLTYHLMDAASAHPDKYKGQAVRVRGLLMRETNSVKLNVTAIDPVGQNCGR